MHAILGFACDTSFLICFLLLLHIHNTICSPGQQLYKSKNEYHLYKLLHKNIEINTLTKVKVLIMIIFIIESNREKNRVKNQRKKDT